MNYFFVDIFVIHTHIDKQTDKQTNKQTKKKKKYEYDFYHSFVFLTFFRVKMKRFLHRFVFKFLGKGKVLFTYKRIDTYSWFSLNITIRIGIWLRNIKRIDYHKTRIQFFFTVIY